jgi:hypothetical protein
MNHVEGPVKWLGPEKTARQERLGELKRHIEDDGKDVYATKAPLAVA